MFCCGGGTKIESQAKSMEEIKNTKSLGLKININDYSLSFDPLNAEWNTNFSNNLVESNKEKEAMQRIKKLADEEEAQRKQIEEVEKLFQSKVSEILIVTKVHCQTKTDIQELFDEIGVSHGDIEKIKEFQKQFAN
mmetsp:Transcript_8793/g.9148  ORF Transcript_8793/g.9148 Transcript_8793/m.9148 type:complete len:136 (+) Transcript_8793:3-410(+)